MEDGRFVRLSILGGSATRSKVYWFCLSTVTVLTGCARALQRNSIRTLRAVLLVRLLRLGSSRFRDFVGVTGVCAANWIDHRKKDRPRVDEL